MVKPATLIALAAAACNSNRPAAPPPSKPPPAPPAPALTGSADPWNSPAGSTRDIPTWASDPPAVLRDKIVGLNAHVIVLKAADMPEYRDVLETAEQTPGVVAAEAFIFFEGTVARGSGAPVDAALKAVDPTRVDRVLTISKHVTPVDLSTLGPNDIVLGDELAHKLGAALGDAVTVALPASDNEWEHVPARSHTYRVTGTFHVDFDEYDGRLGLLSLAAGQALASKGDQAMGIEMVVKDVEHADTVAHALDTRLGGMPFQVMDWYELNKNLFRSLYGDKRP